MKLMKLVIATLFTITFPAHAWITVDNDNNGIVQYDEKTLLKEDGLIQVLVKHVLDEERHVQVVSNGKVNFLAETALVMIHCESGNFGAIKYEFFADRDATLLVHSMDAFTTILKIPPATPIAKVMKAVC